MIDDSSIKEVKNVSREYCRFLADEFETILTKMGVGFFQKTLPIE